MKNQIDISLNKDDSGRGDGFPVPTSPDIEECGIRKSKVFYKTRQRRELEARECVNKECENGWLDIRL